MDKIVVRFNYCPKIDTLIDKLILRFDDSYCPRIDALIDELLGSEIILQYVGKKSTEYEYEGPLLYIAICNLQRMRTMKIKILNIEYYHFIYKSLNMTLYNALMYIDKTYYRCSPLDYTLIHNPIFQVLENYLYCRSSKYNIRWKGFNFIFTELEITISYGDEIIFTRISPDMSRLLWIEKIIGEMSNGSSELLQYSFKRMKSAKKIEL
jgi:hypothetical protein